MQSVFDDGMMQNLIAEGIGIIVTLVAITWIGGWIATTVARRAFEKRWAGYRRVLSNEVVWDQSEIDQDLSCLSNTMKAIAKKTNDDIELADLKYYRSKKKEIEGKINNIESLFQRAHFAFREKDIEICDEYIFYTHQEVRSVFSRNSIVFKEFDAMILSHLEGRADLNQSADRLMPGGTRRDFMISCADQAVAAIAGADTEGWMKRGNMFVRALSS